MSRRESDPRFPAALAFFVTALLVGSGIVVFAWRADAADTDHGQVRYHSPHKRDVDACHWRTDVWRFRFDRTSHGRQIAGWRFLRCVGADCAVVEHSGRTR